MTRKKVDTDTGETSKEYFQRKPKYEKLGINLTQALELFIKDEKINYLSISHRVKDESSFLEKINRKKYEDVFEEIEDFCGIRIICFYQSDVDKISKIISKEFTVLENEDKETLLQPDQFGYRSTHFIVKIKENWLQAPNYRGLENLKAEIQVRTILMHAWAEIQHKLAYKSETHIPDQFKRKFNRISAKLEEADEQFEELRNSITNYKVQLDEIMTELDNITPIELNLDSMQTFLDSKFPEKNKSIEDTRDLVDDFIKHDVTINDLIQGYERVKEYLPEIEKEAYENKPKPNNGFAQVGMARTIMDIVSDKFFSRKDSPEVFQARNEKWRKIIAEKEANR